MAEKPKTPRTRRSRGRRPRRLSMALAALALITAAVPAFVLADGPWSEDAWRLDEIGYLPPEPVAGRRLFVEEITVTGTLALVTLRAATDLKLDVRSYGGQSGRVLTFFVYHHMQQGDSETFGVSLDGPRPVLHLRLAGRAGADRSPGPQGQDNCPHPLPDGGGRGLRH